MNDQGFQLVADAFGLDAFQRIAAREVLRDLERYAGVWPPAPDSEHERLLIELGAIVGERLEGLEQPWAR